MNIFIINNGHTYTNISQHELTNYAHMSIK